MSDATHCLCIEVRTAAQKLTKLYDAALADFDITVTQLSQLNAIRKLGAPTLTDLSIETELDRSTLGRNIRLMEQQGLVAMTSGQDARTRVVKLTRKGHSTLRRAGPAWWQVQSSLIDQLGLEKRQLLQELLSDLSGTAYPGHARP